LIRPNLRAIVALALLLGLSGCTTVVGLGWPPFYPPVPNYPLTVTKAGTGQGTVTAPPSLNCGPTCQTGYASGNVVTLTATQAAGSAFASWSGGCTGTATTCQVTMSSAKTVTATFNIAAGDTTLPPVPTSVVVGAATLGPSAASYPVTLAPSIDQPCNCAVTLYTYDVNSYHWDFMHTTGTVTPANPSAPAFTLIVPYDPTGDSVIAHFGISAIDAAGNSSATIVGHTYTDIIIPANPNTNAKLTAAWSAPTNNTDGSLLTDLQGYRVYYGIGSANPCPSGTFVSTGLVTSVVLTGLTNTSPYTASIVAVNTSNVASACSAPATGVAHP
jgi:hypothetical protein